MLDVLSYKKPRAELSLLRECCAQLPISAVAIGRGNSGVHACFLFSSLSSMIKIKFSLENREGIREENSSV